MRLYIKNFLFFSVFLFNLVFSTQVGAYVFFESADEPFFGDGRTSHVIDDNIWPFHRFEVTENDFQLQGIGGVFRNYSNNDYDIFGAVIQLDGPEDFPNSANLSTDDVLGFALINVEGMYLDAVPVDKSAQLILDLQPGWYALGYGMGNFGADNTAPLSSRVGMPLYWGDLDLDQDHFYASQKNQAFYPATPHIGNPSPRFYAFGEKVDFVIQPPATPKLPFLPVAPKSPTTPNEPILPSAPKAPTTPGVPASAFLLMDLEIERDLGSVHAPEPATIVLIGGGVLGMVWRRKNRKYTNK